MAPRDRVNVAASGSLPAAASADWGSDPEHPARAALARYRSAPPAARQFARWKLRLDPMFPRLAQLVGQGRRLLDVGCGLAVPATWLLAGCDAWTVVATEPDAARAAIARVALGERGVVHELAAPALPDGETGFDAAVLLDVAHYLDDADLAATLTAIRARLRGGAPLVIRDTVPGPGRATWWRRLEGWRLRRRGIEPRFRGLESLTAELAAVGYGVTVETIPAREELWLIAHAAAGSGSP